MTMTETNATTYTAPGADLPVLFVVEHDPISLHGLLSDLSHRRLPAPKSQPLHRSLEDVAPGDLRVLAL
jgi:hypothetical protein